MLRPLLLTALLLYPALSFACDYCSVYSATGLHGFQTKSFAVNISNTYTTYSETPNASQNGFLPTRDAEILEEYNTTSINLMYDFSETFGIQLVTPIIYRSFENVDTFIRSSDSDAGLGDMVISARYAPLITKTDKSVFYLGFNLGLKVPTGDSDPLKQQNEGDLGRRLRHSGGVGTGVQGRNFSLGSGSVDVLFGTTAFYQHLRWFGVFSGQYGLRTEGESDFEFGDDFTWNFGPGYYPIMDEDLSFGILLNVLGEYKAKDKQDGQSLGGTEILNLYAGPELLFAGFGRWTSELGVDIPFYTDDSDALAEPDVRIRFSIGRRFG